MTSARIEQTYWLVREKKESPGVLEELEVTLLARSLQTCGQAAQETRHTQTATHRQRTSDTGGQLVVGNAVGGG